MHILISRALLYKQLHTLLDMGDGVNVEQAIPYRIYHFFAQHQFLDVGLRNQNTLGSGESPLFAKLEEAFDLMGNTANCLDLAALVHRTGHRQILPDRQLCQRGQDAVKLCTGCAVAVNAVVTLLKQTQQKKLTRGISVRRSGPGSR